MSKLNSYRPSKVQALVKMNLIFYFIFLFAAIYAAASIPLKLFSYQNKNVDNTKKNPLPITAFDRSGVQKHLKSSNLLLIIRKTIVKKQQFKSIYVSYRDPFKSTLTEIYFCFHITLNNIIYFATLSEIKLNVQVVLNKVKKNRRTVDLFLLPMPK